MVKTVHVEGEGEEARWVKDDVAPEVLRKRVKAKWGMRELRAGRKREQKRRRLEKEPVKMVLQLAGDKQGDLGVTAKCQVQEGRRTRKKKARAMRKRFAAAQADQLLIARNRRRPAGEKWSRMREEEPALESASRPVKKPRGRRGKELEEMGRRLDERNAEAAKVVERAWRVTPQRSREEQDLTGGKEAEEATQEGGGGQERERDVRARAMQVVTFLEPNWRDRLLGGLGSGARAVLTSRRWQGQDRWVVNKCGTYEVDVRELRTMRPGCYVSDLVINMIGELFAAAEGRVGVYPTTFTSMMLAESTTAEHMDLQLPGLQDDKDWLFFPTHRNGNHWVLVACHLLTNRLVYCDSMLSATDPVPGWVSGIEDCVNKRLERPRGWQRVNGGVPRQTAGSNDCAMAVLFNMVHLAITGRTEYTPARLSAFRPEVHAMMLYATLNPSVGTIREDLDQTQANIVAGRRLDAAGRATETADKEASELGDSSGSTDGSSRSDKKGRGLGDKKADVGSDFFKPRSEARQEEAVSVKKQKKTKFGPVQPGSKRELEVTGSGLPPCDFFKPRSKERCGGATPKYAEFMCLEPKPVPGFERYGVGTGASGIAGAGTGLFARQRFKKGQFICPYTGKEITLAELYSDQNKSVYCSRKDDGTVIDAAGEGWGPGKFANDSGVAERDNAEIRAGRCGYGLYAIGEGVEDRHEIFVAYDGPFFVNAIYPLAMRRMFAVRYPEFKYRLEHIDGEGSCEHAGCCDDRRSVMRYWEHRFLWDEETQEIPELICRRNEMCREGGQWLPEWDMEIDGEEPDGTERRLLPRQLWVVLPGRFGMPVCGHVGCKRRARRGLTELGKWRDKPTAEELARNRACNLVRRREAAERSCRSSTDRCEGFDVCSTSSGDKKRNRWVGSFGLCEGVAVSTGIG